MPISDLFFGLEAALLARDDLGLALGSLVGGRRPAAQSAVGVERLDVAAQSSLGARRVVAERTAVVEVQAHVSVELQLRITYHAATTRIYHRCEENVQVIIDREFVTSAKKKIANFNEFSEIKKIRKNSFKKFVKCPSVGLNLMRFTVSS